MFALIGAVAIAAAFGFIVISDDASAVSYDLSGDDFAEVDSSVTYTLAYDVDADTKYTSKLIDANGNEMTSAVTSGTGTMYKDSTTDKTITVRVPKEAGNYRLVVTLTNTNGDVLETITAPLKAVEPVVLSATLKNDASAERELIIYFVINGVKVEDSKQDITVPAKGTKEVTYHYVVRDVSDGEFYLIADDSSFGGQITGLGPDHTHKFYVEDKSYTFLEVTAVVVLLIVVLLMIWVYRKPVKNYGKPKSRR